MKDEKRKIKKVKVAIILTSAGSFLYSFFIIHFSLLTVLSGCQGGGESSAGLGALNGIADTVRAGESRQVLLTDLTGGYYFDDAFRQPEQAQYGYSRWGRRFIAGWEVAGESGGRLDAEPVECVVTAASIIRAYKSGLREEIFLPPGTPGMLVSLKTPSEGIVFRPRFDIRELNWEDAPDYALFTGKGERFAVARSDTDGGWVGVAGKGIRLVWGESRVRVVHERGALTGRVSVSDCLVPGELAGGRRALIAFGWGDSPESAIAVADEIVHNHEMMQQKRAEWAREALSGISFDCGNKPFTRAFARARLTLAGLLVTRPLGGPDSLEYSSPENTFLLTGIPYAPHPDGWFTCFSIPGIAAMEGTPARARELLRPILARQNLDSTSAKYGMLPGRVDAGGCEYRIPMITGLAAIAGNELFRRLATRDSLLEESVAKACLNDLLGSVRRRLINGVTAGDSADHILWDGLAAPRRAGATIETQALFGQTRGFLMKYPRLEQLAVGIPSSLLKDSPTGWTITSFRVAGPKKLMEAAEEAWRTERYVAGATELFTQPLPTDVALTYFRFLGREPEADRLPLVIEDSTRRLDPTAPDTTVRAAQFLGKHWEFPGDRKRLAQMMEQAAQYDMLTPLGLRSLSPNAPDYQPQHLFLDEATAGTLYMGDALVWTSGVPADAYIIAGDWERLREQAVTLADFILTRGVIGALPEATDAEAVAGVVNINGSPVFAASLAEFIRITAGGIIGVVPDQGRLLRLRPRLPDDWGEFRIEASYRGGKVWLERKSATSYKIGEEGIQPDVRVVLDVIPADCESAQISLRIIPGDKLAVNFVPTGDGHWRGEIEGW